MAQDVCGSREFVVKIIRIIARLNIGGPARNAVLLTTSLDSFQATSNKRQGTRKYETVLVCGEVGEGEGDMGYLAREKGIEPVIVPELSRELSFRNDWGAFWKIYKIICKEKPDIIHTHTAKAGTLGRLAGIVFRAKQALQLQKKQVILVHTFHGHVLHSYFGRIKTWFFIWVEKVLAIFTDRIVTVSEALKKELIEKFRIAPEKKFSVVELGFDLDELLRLPAREGSDCVNIGIVGRLVAVKNHRMLLRSVKKLIAHSLRLIGKVKFVIIGDGELRRELENYVRELGIEDIVEFRGWVRDLRKIYEEMDIMVLTSLNEGTPVSIIEAMAAGRSVVATRVGGVSDIVRDGKSGYLVGPDDEQSFAEKLVDLIKDREKRVRFGECGRGLARERFSKEKLIRDMERVYREIASAATRPPMTKKKPRNDRDAIF